MPNAEGRMREKLGELQRFLDREIPLSRHLRLNVEAYDGSCLTLSAPLEGNHNHQETAFAGSLSALATLAGWGLMWILLGELGIAGHIVIQSCTVSFLHPVTADFRARCCKPTHDRLAIFAETLTKRRKARLELEANITRGDQVAVRFTGRYAALLDRAED